MIEVEWRLRFNSLHEYKDFKNTLKGLKIVDLDLEKVLKKETVILKLKEVD